MRMTVNDTVVTLVTLQLVYHHVMQGDHAGQPWMVSFCSVCNGGGVFSPVVDGRVHTFREQGFYDAMILLYDDQSGSYWDHLLGVCVHGPLAGKRLERLSDLVHTLPGPTLLQDPQAVLGLTQLSEAQWQEAAEDDAWRREDYPEWSDCLTATLGTEDMRLPRLDIGLGVWAGRLRKFYPVKALYAAHSAVIDEFAGRRLLVYIDPTTNTATAVFTDATRVVWDRDILRFDNGDSIRDGVVLDKQDKVKTIERPLQLLSRWYAFAVKYSGCDIYDPPVGR
jgi:hypothetical protein